MKHLESALNTMQHMMVGVHPIQTFIKVENNIVQFQIQDGPVKEVNSVNGCQASDMLVYIRNLFISLNSDFPCSQNEVTIQSLNQAIIAQADRTADRLVRGVEGENKL